MGRKSKEDKIEVSDIAVNEDHPVTFNGNALLTPELKLAISQIEKAHGEGAIMSLGSYKASSPVKRISSGAIGLDSVLGGGFVFGRVVEIYGPEGCLAPDTFIQYTVNSDGKRYNSKGGTIERLYERFHNIKPSGNGQGKYQRDKTKNATFQASCINEDNKIIQNKIIDVVQSGVKKCFLLKLETGEYIKATADHKFFNGKDYVALSALKIGDSVFIHNNTPFKQSSKKQCIERAYFYVKYHPNAPIKNIVQKCGKEEKTYTYCVVKRSLAVIEASMNNMTLKDYVAYLNNDNKLPNIKYLDKKLQIHHKNENVLDDSLENLVVLSCSEHSKLHALKNHNNLRFTVTPSKIVSIEDVGDSMTYDIRMLSPYNNYIANKFVVHNSGKTTMMLELLARAQALGLRCAFIDMEHNLNPSYAIDLGVNLDNVLIAQPGSGEEALDIAEKLFGAKIDIVFLDSIAALNSVRDQEKDITESAVMASKAALLTRFFERNQDVIAKNGVLFICSNQQRAKMNAMHAGGKGTPGGYALKYWASIRLEITWTEALKNADGVVYGQMLHIKAVKNKFNAPFKETLVTLVYGKGIDKLKNWIEVASEVGVLQKSGTWYNYGEVRLGQGIEQSKEFLSSNPQVFEEIKDKTTSLVGAGWCKEGKE